MQKYTVKAQTTAITALAKNNQIIPAGEEQFERSPVSPDVQMNRAARFGHSFAAVSVSPAPPDAIQPKLTVGAPDDEYEDEADNVAGQVMRMPDSSVQRALISTPEDKLEDEEDRPSGQVMRKAAGAEGSFDAGAAAVSRIAARRGGGSPLPENTRAFMEPRFGADFGGVRVHADAEADQISKDLSARAFTTGNDIYFRQDEYSPSSVGGQELLAHELTHVVQQNTIFSSPSNLVQRGKKKVPGVDDAQAKNIMQQNAVVLQNTLILYTGTNDKNFSDGLIAFAGSQEDFVTQYMSKNLKQGQAAQMGAGIYATPDRDAALGYGKYLLQIVVQTGASYLDLSNVVVTKSLRNAGVKPNQWAKANPDCVIRFNGNYHIIKTNKITITAAN